VTLRNSIKLFNEVSNLTNVGCKIIKDFERISNKALMKYKHLPVANIGDSMNRMAALDSKIFPLNEKRLFGTAFTVKVPEGDNLMFHKAMDLAQEGDIILIDAGGNTNRAILGELMAHYCQSRGIKGIVVDGCVRDKHILRELEIPVYAKGISPNGPYKNGPGEINTPISIGGKVVNPGDIVIGDADGLVVIDKDDALSVLEAAQAVFEKEATIMQTIENEGTYNRPWVDDLLKDLDCEIIEKL